MLVLCLAALAQLGLGTLIDWSESTNAILSWADTGVCLIFFADFVYTLISRPDKLHYLRTWGWIDLLSSIPAVDPLRWGRAARVARILRVLRGVKSARAAAHFVFHRRQESAFLAAALLTMLLLVFGSIAILEFERPAGGNIVNAEDAMWWVASTMTTVGYGDLYPITTEGRLIAVMLMTSGVGTFGMLSGLVAAWFLTPPKSDAETDLEEVKELLLEVRDLVALRRRSEPGFADETNAGTVHRSSES